MGDAMTKDQVSTMADDAMRRHVLSLLPQQEPFRFIDEIVELSENHIVSHYCFRPEEYYYRGHFPGDAVTPGVILIETMAQSALVALGIYLLERENSGGKLRTLFTECAIEFFQVVRPGTRVTVRGERVYWRRRKLQSRVELVLENGVVAASGLVSGLGAEVQ